MIKVGDKLVVINDCQIESAIFDKGEVYTISKIGDSDYYNIYIMGIIKDEFDVYDDNFPLSLAEVKEYFKTLAQIREEQIKSVLDGN